MFNIDFGRFDENFIVITLEILLVRTPGIDRTSETVGLAAVRAKDLPGGAANIVSLVFGVHCVAFLFFVHIRILAVLLAIVKHLATPIFAHKIRLFCDQRHTQHQKHASVSPNSYPRQDERTDYESGHHFGSTTAGTQKMQNHPTH